MPGCQIIISRYLPRSMNSCKGCVQSAEMPFAYKSFTDSAPILERELAQRAGLGWIGKNSCLINPENGSFFLLAEVFTDMVLEPDVPFEFDRCGACTRCVDACPTRCIQPDRTIDSRKCISYLTIENKGHIPMELREQVGGWVFGCDICQTVCPWNKPRIGIESKIGKGSSELTILISLKNYLRVSLEFKPTLPIPQSYGRNTRDLSGMW